MLNVSMTAVWIVSFWSLNDSGVECELLVTEGGPHAFEDVMPKSSPSIAHWDSVFTFMRRVLEHD